MAPEQFERQREIACGMLTKLRYNPEAVSSGEEAIEYMKENAVDLIVLDMVMPKGINGRKTEKEVPSASFVYPACPVASENGTGVASENGTGVPLQ